MAQTSYAVLFEDGPGYLLVDLLGNGTFATVYTVVGPDGLLYARKVDQSYEIKVRDPQSEDVAHFRPHTNIPRLITHRQYSDPSNTNQVLTASTWQFCNGGTLEGMRKHLTALVVGDNFRQILPEPFIWSITYDLINVLTDVATGHHPLNHGDAHDGNMFLDWSLDRQYPSLYLGDWGVAAGLTLDATRGRNLRSQAQPPLLPAQLQYLISFVDGLISDLANARKCLVTTMTCLKSERAHPPLGLFRDTADLLPMYGYSTAMSDFFEQWDIDLSHLRSLIRVPNPDPTDFIDEYISTMTSLRRIAKIHRDQALAQPPQPITSPDIFDITTLRPAEAVTLPLLYKTLQEVSSNVVQTDGRPVFQLPGHWRIDTDGMYWHDRMFFELSHCKIIELHFQADGKTYVRGHIVPWSGISSLVPITFQ